MKKLNSILIAVTVTILMSLFADTASAQTIELRNGATISNVERGDNHYYMLSSSGERKISKIPVHTLTKPYKHQGGLGESYLNFAGINWSWISLLFAPTQQHKANVLKPTRKAYMTYNSK